MNLTSISASTLSRRLRQIDNRVWEVRGIHKSRVVVGLKMIGRNFQQAMHCLTRRAKNAANALKEIGNKLDIPTPRGESVLVAS